MSDDEKIFIAGQEGRFGANHYLQSSYNWETFEFGKRIPDGKFQSRKGSTITLDTNRRFRLTYTDKGSVLMNEIR